MAIKIDYSSSTLNRNLYDLGTKIGAAVLMLASTEASRLESKMKINRPWTDRTGMAKATLRASVSQPSKDKIRITLSHGVDYGIWLELAHEKNWAIIAPTINQEGPEVVKRFQGLMDRIGSLL